MSTAVLEGGDGPPVVILHGNGQFAATWTRVIPQLLNGHRLIVPDLPGEGASEVLDGKLDAERVLDWLGELIAATCPSPPALVGQSLGGAIAARFAGEHVGRLRTLVLIDSFGLSAFRPAPKFALAMVGFLALPNEQTRDRLFGQCMVDFDGVHAEMGADWDLIAAYALEGARTPSVKAAGRKLMKAFGVSAIPESHLARIAVPTTLIWGRQDLQTRLRVGETASARHGWPLRVIDDCGADPHIEQPDALATALTHALDNE